MGVIPQKQYDSVYNNRHSTGINIKDGDRNKFLNYFMRLREI